ncbi:MAG: PAS domain S-box protein [candidate division Zixibacteria bacterium]|nr:PAS domain S-box protein [candidate division Zixibacteria bacterium]
MTSQRVADFLAIAAAGIGVMVLVGWLTDNAILTSIDPSCISMKPNTAVCMILIAMAVVLVRRSPVAWRVTARVICGVVAAMALLTIGQYVKHADFGVDRLLYHAGGPEPYTVYPGRMSPVASILFLAVSAAVGAMGTRCGARVTKLAWPFCMIVTTTLMIGYVFGSVSLVSLSSDTPISLPALLAFTMLGVAIFAVHPDRSLLSALNPSTPGGLLWRGLLIPALLVLVVVGWLRVQAEMAGLIDMRFGVALFTVLVGAFIVVLAGRTAMTLNRMDAERERIAAERDRYFSSSLDLVCVADLNGRFLRVNPAWGRTLGFSDDELLSRPFMDFIHPDDREKTIAAYDSPAQGHEVTALENRYRRKDGTYVWLNWNATAPTGPDRLIYAAARDVTEQKTHEEHRRALTAALEHSVEEARAANKELEAFSYSVSHDLRAPLRAIDGFARILTSEHASQLDTEGHRLLDVVRENSGRMGQLIDDLLQFSRLGRKDIEPRTVDMTALVHRTVERLRPDMGDRKIALHLHPLPPASGDAALLEVVWTNLLSNAIKYTRPRAEAQIEVSGEIVDGHRVYRVRDNGVGFDMQYAQKLFGVFQRLHPATEFEGTGVGLALVQRILHRHGGRVWVDAKPDQGAVFEFELPTEGGVHAVPV